MTCTSRRHHIAQVAIFTILVCYSCTAHENHSKHQHDHEHTSNYYQWIYAISASLFVSLLSLTGVFFVATALNENLQFFLSSLAIGSLLGDTFLHLIPAIFSGHSHAHDSHDDHSHDSSNFGLIILISFFFCFFMEIYLRSWQQQEEKVKENALTHHHIKAFGWLNIFGDGVHNFMDGIGLAGAFQISSSLGIANTLCVCFHELPQELSDFGVLLSAGFKIREALFLNLLSALFAVLGCVLGLLLNQSSLSSYLGWITNEKALVSITAGSFLYIVASMIPEMMCQLQKKSKTNNNRIVLCIVGISIGTILMLVIGQVEHHIIDFFTK